MRTARSSGRYSWGSVCPGVSTTHPHVPLHARIHPPLLIACRDAPLIPPAHCMGCTPPVDRRNDTRL